MMPTSWTVLIADLRSSRAFSARDRREIDRALARAISGTRRFYAKHIRLGPEVLKGDEVQAVVRSNAPALSILTHLRAGLVVEAKGRIALRAGIGGGRIDRLSPKGPFASDGEAFHRARAALDRAKEGGGTRLTAWASGDAFFDAVSDTVLGLADAFVSRWTVAQWEAVRGRLEGRGQSDIGQRTGVSFQSVSKRLRAASWTEVHAALALTEGLARAAQPPGRQPPGRIHHSEVEMDDSPSGG